MATQKSTTSAGSPAEVIDIEETKESNIKIIACSNGTSKDAKNDSDTETEDESDSKMEKEAIDGDKIEGQGSDKLISHPAKANGIDDSLLTTPPYIRKKRIKLEDVQNFDILLPNDRNNHGVREAKKDFYNGFVSYRKLVDRLRPVFMECDTSVHKTKISQWLVGKITDRGGRFLKEDGDGTAGNCKVMSHKESIQYTIYAFEDRQKLPDIEAFLEGKLQTLPPADTSSQARLRNPLAMPQQQEMMLAPSFPQDISSLGHEALAGANRVISEQFNNPHASCEPPKKKTRMRMPFFNTTAKMNPLKKPLQETENQSSPAHLQKMLRERQLIRTELTENQEILLMRQERLSQLEGEYRIFQDRQMFLPSERWLAEKILLQEELFENRELLGIQHQRCRRLTTLLELNETQMFEKSLLIGREKLKLEDAQSISKSGVEYGKSTTKEDSGQEGKGVEAGEKESTGEETRAMMEAEIQKQQQQNARNTLRRQRQIAMEHLEFKRQAELKKRAALEQRTAIEHAFEQKTAMEHEIQYRQAMGHAMKRQQTMQHAMEVQKLMMRRGEIAQAAITSDAALLEAASLQSSRSGIPKEATPDIQDSLDTGAKQTTIEAREAGGQQTNEVSVSTEEKYNGGDTAAAEESDDDDDDEYSIVI